MAIGVAGERRTTWNRNRETDRAPNCRLWETGSRPLPAQIDPASPTSDLSRLLRRPRLRRSHGENAMPHHIFSQDRACVGRALLGVTRLILRTCDGVRGIRREQMGAPLKNRLRLRCLADYRKMWVLAEVPDRPRPLLRETIVRRKAAGSEHTLVGNPASIQ